MSTVETGRRFTWVTPTADSSSIRKSQISSARSSHGLSEEKAKTPVIHYVEDGGRAALNFVASTCRVRNNAIIHEPFNVQKPNAGGGGIIANRASESSQHNEPDEEVGVDRSVSVQLTGYDWIHRIHADQLGVTFSTIPISEYKRRFLNQCMNWKMRHTWSRCRGTTYGWTAYFTFAECF